MYRKHYAAKLFRDLHKIKLTPEECKKDWRIKEIRERMREKKLWESDYLLDLIYFAINDSIDTTQELEVINRLRRATINRGEGEKIREQVKGLDIENNLKFRKERKVHPEKKGHGHGGHSDHGHHEKTPKEKSHGHGDSHSQDHEKPESRLNLSPQMIENEEEQDVYDMLNEDEAQTHKDENMYGVFLHVLADTLGSVGVIISCYLIKWYGWLVSDPICAGITSLLIFASLIPLLKSTMRVLL